MNGNGTQLGKIDGEDRFIPVTVIPLPGAEIKYEAAAQHIFRLIAPARRLFMLRGVVHEVRGSATEAHLVPVSGDRLCVMLESFTLPPDIAKEAGLPRMAGELLRTARYRLEDGKASWTSARFPEASARKLLVTDAAFELLPSIRQLVYAPILATEGLLGQGYHDHAGGTYVLSKKTAEMPSFPDAVATISGLLTDFDFPDEGDRSRALASIISPALKFGGWIDDDFPLDLAEADASQSGKTYRQRLVCAIYGEEPASITPAKGGVGSVDEAIATVLMRGRPFINLGNFRGRLDSTIMEEALRGSGKVHCRALHRAAEVDCSPFLWQLSTNGAELTRDLANRSVITRVRKRPDNHKFQTYPEGDLVSHVKANQPRYLAAVHAIIREWHVQGCPTTNESRHDFRGWCRALDWFVQVLFNAAPLLQGHREEQLRTANPALQWLRSVIILIVKAGHVGKGLGAGDIAELCEENDTPPPGSTGKPTDMRVGSVLARLFRENDGDVITVDGHRFNRQIKHEYDEGRRKNVERKTYFIEEPAPNAPNAPNTYQPL